MIAVLDYGMGNLRSVLRALERAGAQAKVTGRPEEAESAAALVVPGVGAFGACMRNLRATGLDRTITSFIEEDRSVLGVCLGMQVLYECSEESDEPGLGVLAGAVKRLPHEVKVPHIGWNEVRWATDHPLTRAIPSGERLYFVHSYAAPPDPDVTVGVTEHGRPFAAAVARGNLFATQFHPEKSGDLGLSIYSAFVRRAGEASSP